MPYRYWIAFVAAFVAFPGLAYMFLHDLLGRWDVWLQWALWSLGVALLGLAARRDHAQPASFRDRAVLIGCLAVMGTALALPILGEILDWHP